MPTGVDEVILIYWIVRGLQKLNAIQWLNMIEVKKSQADKIYVIVATH